MADATEFRRLRVVVLLLALLVASLDVARLLTVDDDRPRAAPAVSSPASGVPPATAAPPTTGDGGGSATRASDNPTASEVSAGANVATPQTTTPTTEPAAAPPEVPVACQSDLALADSPDAPYNFLCSRDGAPLTWPSDRIRLYTSGLTPEQSAALQVALAQWEAEGRFSVTTVNSPALADVTMSPKDLTNGEGGRTFVHYTCTATCAFDHADVQLSSTPRLTHALWITTILHELGHVAGLSHVSRDSEVMYPELELQSPLIYGAGDVAGLQELARIRDA